MKTRTRILSFLLFLCMVVPMLPLTSLVAWAEALVASSDTEDDAMIAIEADSALSAYKQGSTQSFTDDGYVGIPYEVTVYYDYATHGKATAGFMTEGATPVILYVVNTRAERIGTDSDVDIIKSMLDRGYAVVVADYLNHAKAISPDLEWSTQLLRAKAVAGDYFTDSTVFESGTYVDTLTVPAGYDVRLNDVYFELDKHGVDGTLEEIVTIWNNDFRGVKRDTVIKWVHADGTRKATQVGFDGSTPVWYADAAGTTVDAENGQYIKVGHTKAEVITDCVKPDGTPIDLNLYSHLVYPTHPAKEVPLMVLYSSSGSLGECINKANRPHFAGFLFNGYAGMIAEYAYVPMERSDSYGYWAGDSTGAVTGVNMTYATYTYNATQSASAALRFARYLALSESDTYRIDVDSVGAYGISKTAWYTQLGAPILRENLLTGKTDAEVAQHVNDKINSFVQMLLPDQCNGKTRYDNGITEAYTEDGVTVDGGELQPWASYEGNEISSGVQANYSSCGGFMDYFCEGYAPQFITENLSDTSYTEYGQQNIMVNVSRTMNMPTLWFEVDIQHDLAQGIDHNYGVDVYDAFVRFMNYYLKNTPVSVAYTDPMNGAVIPTTDGVTIKFIGEVRATEIEKIRITDASGNALTGTWTSAYGNTEWTFTADNMKGATAYTLTVPATLTGSNGVAMGTAYTASFYTRAEGDVTSLGSAATLSTSGTTVNLTVPEKSASGFSIRVNVTNDAANTLSAYNAATGELMGSVRVSGTGYHEIDVTDALAGYTAGTELAVRLVTESESGNVAHWEQTLDADQGGMGFKFCELTTGCEIDGELALKIVRTTDNSDGEYSVYPNMENAYTFSTSTLIKNGSSVNKSDLGRTFLITVRVYDTVSRPVRFWMNSATSRSDKQLDFDRCYYTGMTVANEWTEFEIPYTVYEMKYGWKTQVKTFYAQFAPLSGNDEPPIYLDNLKVEEVFTDISVSSIALVSEADSDKPVKAPASENAFLVGGSEYATWKDALGAATSGSTVTMQSNYTLTSSDVVDLSGKTGLTVDLGGYRLTTENTSNAPLWIKASDTSAVTVTLKNGTVILGDTPLVGYGSSTAAGSGKTVNVNVEDVYLTVAKNSDSLNVVSEGTVTSGVKLTSNIKFTDSVIDVERENLPDKTLNGVTVFHSGNSDLTVRYTFVGGAIRMNNFHEVTFCESIVKAEANAEGDYLQVCVPAGVAVPKLSLKKGSTYASLESSSTQNGYAVYDAVDATYSTDYGAVPNEYADGTVYPFAIFMDEAFINGAKTWKDALTLARAALEQKPGGTLQILMRGDRSVDTYVGAANWLCYMNGTVVLDLGGKTLHAKSASLFEAGVDASYTGSFDTTLIVKNGNIFMGNNNICGVQNNTTYTKNFDISFEKVNFSVDTETFDGSKRKHLFYAQNNCKAQVNVDLTLTDCTIDLRGITTDYTVFNYYTSNDLVAANVKFIGGALIADTLSNFTWYTADATDTIRFEKGSDGSYVTLSVPNGTDPAVSLPTSDGVFSFSELVTDGDERDVYTLKNDTTASVYGAIPAGYAENVFVIFTGGSCIGGKDTWKDTLTLVRETLAAKPGVEVQILMQKDREVTSYVGSANWLCYMNGSILLDLNGKTFTAKTTSLFELGADANYTGSYKTTLTVKNGTILQGKGNVCGIQNSSANKKVFDVTFEDVCFGIDTTVFSEGTKNTLFYAQTNCKAAVDVSLTLTDCDIDVGGVGDRAYTVFSFASGDTYVSADITFNGGSIKAETLDTVTFLTLDTTNDTFLWGKGSDSAYTTLTLPEGATLPTIGGKNTEGVSVSFGSGTTSEGYTTYTLVENPLVTDYGMIDEAAEDASAYPFVLFDANKNYVGAASNWYNAQAAAKTYLDANAGKTLYILMRCEQSNDNWYKSDGVLNGTVVLDLGGHTFLRGGNSIIEAGTNGLTEAQCAFTTSIIVKNGTILAGKSTSNNGVVVGIESKVAYNKTYNITFEDVIFGVSAVNYNSEKGMNNLIINDGGGAGTGVVTVNLTLRDCTVKMVSSDTMTVPASTRLFNANNTNNVYVTVEGGSYEGTMSGITFANLSNTDTVTFTKGADGKYFEFDITGGSVPTAAFPTDRGTMYFTKKSGTVYTLAVKAGECGNALIPYEIYDDTEGYPFIVYVEGKLVGSVTTWKAAQEAAKTYLDSNAGGTVYVLMRAEQSNDAWFRSDGVFNGTLVLDLGGNIMHRGANSFLEICTNGLTEAQCAFTTNIIVKNGTILAGKSTNNSGHIVAVQSNGNYNKTFNVTFEDVTFGISKDNYNSEKGIYAVVIRDNGTVSGATGVVTADFLFENCTFDFNDSDDTAVPVADTTVFYTNPSSTPANIDITIKGGVYTGTHQKISFVNASSSTTVTYLPDDNGDYFGYELTAGTPKSGAVNTDSGNGYFVSVGDGVYELMLGELKLTGASVNLGSDLALKYYVKLHYPAVLNEGALAIRFAMNGKTETVTDYELVNGEYVFTFDGIAPQQMADLIDAEVLVGDTVYAALSDYSIKQNCEALLAMSATELGISDAKCAALKQLVSDLLLYGEAAQNYKDYNLDTPIASDVEGLTGSEVLPTESDAMTLTGNVDATLHFTSATVFFDTVNAVIVKIYANVADPTLVTVSINGTDYALSDLESLGNGVYRFKGDGVTATGFGESLTVELSYDGTVTATLTYSVNAYAYAMNNGGTSNAEMQALAVALYRYGQSAVAYVAAE